MLFVIQQFWWRCLSQSVTFLQAATSNVRDFFFFLIITLSPMWMFASLSLWFKLCHSLRVTSYPGWNILHAASLHFNTCFCCFLKISPSSSDVTSWSVGNSTLRPNKVLFGINSRCAISSSMYVRGLFLMLTSMSSNISSSYAHLRCAFANSYVKCLVCEPN